MVAVRARRAPPSRAAVGPLLLAVLAGVLALGPSRARAFSGITQYPPDGVRAMRYDLAGSTFVSSAGGGAEAVLGTLRLLWVPPLPGDLADIFLVTQLHVESASLFLDSPAPVIGPFAPPQPGENGTAYLPELVPSSTPVDFYATTLDEITGLSDGSYVQQIETLNGYGSSVYSAQYDPGFPLPSEFLIALDLLHTDTPMALVHTPTGDRLDYTGSAVTSQLGTLRLVAQAVPEPGAELILSPLALALAARRRALARH